MIFKKESEKQSKDQPHIKKNMAVLRLEKDIHSYQQEKIDFVKLSFPEEHNLQIINVAIRPDQNSPYKQCQVTFQLNFPNTYPIDPPKLKCLNHIYHPNINYEGAVCLPLVREDYNPTVNLTMIICGLIFIMTYPNGEDPLNPTIGDLMVKNPAMYQKIIDYTVQGRTFQTKPYDNIRIK